MNSENKINIPKTLDECFVELKFGDDLEEFINTSENELFSYHNSLGRFLRNEWGLWVNENDLCQFFHSIGINHADDMSNIILISFHRHLHNKSIDLKSQVLNYWSHWTNEKVEQHLPPNIINISDEYLNLYKK